MPSDSGSLNPFRERALSLTLRACHGELGDGTVELVGGDGRGGGSQKECLKKVARVAKRKRV